MLSSPHFHYKFVHVLNANLSFAKGVNFVFNVALNGVTNEDASTVYLPYYVSIQIP